MAAGYENARPEIHAAEARTLPARHYADPELFRRELDAIHHDMWLHAGRTEALDAPGRYFLVRFAGVNLIVLRDEQGGVAAFHNTCRHRGTLLCREDSGRLAGSIQCPYHAWTYGLDGALRSAPLMEKVVGFDLARARPRPRRRGRVGRPRLREPVAPPAPAFGAPGRPRPQVRRVAHGRAAPGRAPRLPPEGQLEARDPELLGVPALPDRAPVAQPAVALHERGQRAAAADLAGRQHGAADRRRDAFARRPDAARSAARPGRAAAPLHLLLCAAPEPAPEPAPGLRADVPGLAPGRGPHRRRVRVALPPRRDGATGLRREGRGRVLGPHQPPGLGAHGARAGGHLERRLSSRVPTPTARNCSWASTASCSSGWRAAAARRPAARRGSPAPRGARPPAAPRSTRADATTARAAAGSRGPSASRAR